MHCLIDFDFILKGCDCAKTIFFRLVNCYNEMYDLSWIMKIHKHKFELKTSTKLPTVQLHKNYLY